MPEDPNAELSRQDYWDNRYGQSSAQGESSYDWLRNFEIVRPFLERHLPAPQNGVPKILHLGNGNSVGHDDYFFHIVDPYVQGNEIC